MNRIFASLLLTLMCGCANYGQLEFITKLPSKLDEVSGIAMAADSLVWVIEDRGNPDNLYQVDFKGNLLRDIDIENGANEDWEDLTRDSIGNIYIADTGNNNLKSQKFVIYKIPSPADNKADDIEAIQIDYVYPGGDEGESYDSEALFYHKGWLFIVTKNRRRPFTGESRLFRIPARKGKWTAELIREFTTCDTRRLCEVTAADMSPDGRKLALLGYGKLWVYSGFTGDDFMGGQLKTYELGATTQLESLCFMDNFTVLLADEERAGSGRNLYRFGID